MTFAPTNYAEIMFSKNLRFIAIITILTIIFITDSKSLFAQKGSLKGVVFDKKTNETIIGASVLIVGTQTGVTTNVNGEFLIPGIKPGTYSLQISFISYKTKVINKIAVSADKVTDVGRIELEEEAQALKGVTIQERRKTDSELSTISSIKKSDLVVSAISSQQISRSQDKDASEVIRRVPGITIVNDRFVVLFESAFKIGRAHV
jgi:hypothetical protein